MPEHKTLIDLSARQEKMHADNDKRLAALERQMGGIMKSIGVAVDQLRSLCTFIEKATGVNLGRPEDWEPGEAGTTTLPITPARPKRRPPAH